jgi:hypothetical protein
LPCAITMPCGFSRTLPSAMNSEDYKPEPYICADYAYARAHKWYGMSRMVTQNDLYAFDPNATVDLEIFTDIAAAISGNQKKAWDSTIPPSPICGAR